MFAEFWDVVAVNVISTSRNTALAWGVIEPGKFKGFASKNTFIIFKNFQGSKGGGDGMGGAG